VKYYQEKDPSKNEVLKYEIGVHQVNVDGISFWLDKQS
jgi:hypothetical protein